MTFCSSIHPSAIVNKAALDIAMHLSILISVHVLD
jgi:hypothetical protein